MDDNLTNTGLDHVIDIAIFHMRKKFQEFRAINTLYLLIIDFLKV